MLRDVKMLIALNTLNTRAGPKRKRRLLQRRSQELRLLEKDYHGAKRIQASLPAWQKEAARLAYEYTQTGRELHRFAFERHMGGILMRMREGRA